jgi:hypothetical protein
MHESIAQFSSLPVLLLSAPSSVFLQKLAVTVGQDIPQAFKSLRVYYRVHKNTSLAPGISQTNTLSNLISGPV